MLTKHEVAVTLVSGPHHGREFILAYPAPILVPNLGDTIRYEVAGRHTSGEVCYVYVG